MVPIVCGFSRSCGEHMTTINLRFTGKNGGLESGSLYLGVLYKRKPGGSILA